MSEIKFFCPHCGKQIQCDTSYCGSEISCPACQQPMTVPHPTSDSMRVSTPQTQKTYPAARIAITVTVIAVLIAGLFLYWRSQAGGLAASWSWNGKAHHDGTVVGKISYKEGMAGRAFSFDGKSGYVLIPDSPALDAFSNCITVEAWIKVNRLAANPEWEGIVTKGNASWRLLATSGAKTVYFASSGTTPSDDISGTRNVNDGKWHDVAAVYDGTNLSLYVDGTLDVSKAASGSIRRNSDPVCIGYIANTGLPGNYHFNGLIDDVSINYRALSPREIAAQYHSHAGNVKSAD
jgi:hypothetical protein